MPNPPAPFTVSLAVPRQEVVELTARPDLPARLDRLGLAFLTFGLDRFTSDAGPGPGPDPATVISFVARHFARTGLVAACAPHRDHPYNVARRAASADHIARGRSGVLLGFRDRALTSGGAWGGDGLQPPVPLTRESVADAAVAIQRLWQSFPVESIVASRVTRQFVDPARIRPVDHVGSYRIAGPLSVPTTPQGSPVLLGYVTSPQELHVLRDSLDLAVLGAEAGSGARAPVPGSAEVRVIREIAFDVRNGGGADLVAKIGAIRESGAVGALVTLARGTTLAEFAGVAEAYAGQLGLSAGRPGQTLRAALGLPRRNSPLDGARAAVPASAN